MKEKDKDRELPAKINIPYHSVDVLKKIGRKLWIWEKIGDNLWKVYPYNEPENMHLEDDKGNTINK